MPAPSPASRQATISFTASREGFAPVPSVVVNVLCQVPDADRYMTGACTGGDAFIGRWLRENRAFAEHVVVVPADRSRVEYWWDASDPFVTVLDMPEGTTYADRNAELVSWADVVFGLPAYPEDDPRSLRSGTWQTIRMARRAGKLHRWDCVMPPYHGRIERPVSSLLAADLAEYRRQFRSSLRGDTPGA